MSEPDINELPLSFLAEIVYQVQLIEYNMTCNRTPCNLFLPIPPNRPTVGKAELLKLAAQVFRSIKLMLDDGQSNDAESRRIIHCPAVLELSCCLKCNGYLHGVNMLSMAVN